MGISKHNIGSQSSAAISRPRFGPGDRSSRRAVALAVAFLVTSACQSDSEDGSQKQIETVDVAPALNITTDGDQEAVVRPPELMGVLPSDFPGDLPLYLPASLVDFGTTEGRPYVSLLTPSPLARVERELARLVREGGWTSEGSGASKVLRNGARQVRLRIENARPGTLYHIEY